MACRFYEQRIHSSVDGPRSAPTDTALAAHLASCAECRDFARQLHELDAALTRALPRPVLTTEFSTRLRQRIESEPALSQTRRAELKGQLQGEFEACWRKLRHGPSLLPRLGEGLGLALPIALTTALLWELMPDLVTWLGEHAMKGVDLSLLFSLVAGAVFLAMSLGLSGLMRLWSSLKEI